MEKLTQCSWKEDYDIALQSRQKGVLKRRAPWARTNRQNEDVLGREDFLAESHRSVKNPGDQLP